MIQMIKLRRHTDTMMGLLTGVAVLVTLSNALHYAQKSSSVKAPCGDMRVRNGGSKSLKHCCDS